MSPCGPELALPVTRHRDNGKTTNSAGAERVNSPTLVVRGATSDVIAMDTAEELHRRIPNSKLATVDRAGHLVMGDNPSGFQKAVREFLTELG